jgi:outer membrane protein assembly complex protein YaeT
MELDCDAQLSLQEFREQILQEIGEPLDAEKVAGSLKNLWVTGRFRDLRAEAERVESGVVVLFAARAAYFVGVVSVEGTPEPLDERILVAASRLRLGERVEEAELQAARDRLLGVLAENGFYEAKVEYRVEPNPRTQDARILFSVRPGPPARLGRVEFQGALAVSAEKLASASKWHPGQHLTAARLERGLFNIHRLYTKLGRLQALATVKSREYGPASRSEALVVQIEEGPRVEVLVEGARVSTSKLRELLPFYREGTLDEAAVARGGRNLEDYFQRQGYFSAAVQGTRKETPDAQQIEIVYTVTLGERGHFVGYAFHGNRAVPTAELAAALQIQPRDFRRERGTFSRELLDSDMRALLRVYESHGFLAARVAPQLDTWYHGKPGQLFVTLDIEEGPKTTVAQLELSGVETEMRNGLWPLLLNKPGKPYSPRRAETDRELIVNYLADRGYLRATASWEASPGPSPTQVSLRYQVEPGKQERIRDVILLGYEHTRPGTIRRELTLRRGDPLSQSAMLESQRRLYDLGTFSQVLIAPQNPESPETTRNLLVSVEEARRWTVGYGGGLEIQRLGSNDPEGQLRASPRLSFEVSRLNVGGRAQSFNLRARLSALERGGAFSYLIPRFPTRRDLSLRLGGLMDRSRDVLTFTSKRREASISLEKRYSPTTFIAGRYSFRRVEALDVRIEDQELIPLFARPARVAMLGASYANDHRNDPADATEGSYSLADIGVSWRQLGSQSNFLRVSGQNATYYRLASHLVFARNTRFAVESTLGPVTPTGEIPLPERFFLGGGESHRGFYLNQGGPRDSITGFPIGGNALFLNSLELRVPFASNKLGFVLFHDAGNVFSSIRRLRLLKVKQNSPTDFDYSAHALGLGVRYRTPVGPVRFDVGYNLNPARYQVLDQITQAAEVRRLPNILFFLSIGQSF